MSIAFAAPASGGNALSPADIEGHLLVVEPVEYRENVPTKLGESDAIQVTVHDITTSSTHHDILWFSRVLVGSLKSRIGQKVLGVMGKGEAKAGQSAPWVLIDASGDAASVQAATAYLTSATSAQLTGAMSTDDLVKKLEATVINK
jgi:hypothetical protein